MMGAVITITASIFFLTAIISPAFAYEQMEGHVIYQNPGLYIIDHRAYMSVEEVWDDDHVIPSNGATPVYGSIVNLTDETIYDSSIYYRFYDDEYNLIDLNERIYYKFAFRDVLKPNEVSLFEVYPPDHTRCYEIWVDYTTPLELSYPAEISGNNVLEIQNVVDHNGVIVGSLKNNSSDYIENIWVRLFKFDEDGNYYGTKTDFITDLGGDLSKKFEIESYYVGWPINTPKDAASYEKPFSYDIVAFSFTIDHTWANPTSILGDSFEDFIFYVDYVSPYYYGGEKPFSINLDDISLKQNNAVKSSCVPNPEPLQTKQKLDVNVPSWVKIRAEWWADGIVSDDDFISGMKLMVDKGIIKISESLNKNTKIYSDIGYFTINKDKYNISKTPQVNVEINGRTFDDRNNLSDNYFLIATYPDGNTEKIFLSSKTKEFSKDFTLNFYSKPGKYILQGICNGSCTGNEGTAEFIVEKHYTEYIEESSLVCPTWVKTVVKLWSIDQMSNTEFSILIKYLMDEGIIQI